MVAASKLDAVTAALQLAPEDRERLARLAAAQGGNVDELVRAWVLAQLEEAEESALVEARMAQHEVDGLAVPQEEVLAWAKSLGTAQVLPCPKPRRM